MPRSPRAYDASGNLAGASDALTGGSTSSTGYTYDALGRVLSETQTASGVPTVVFAYTYDSNGNVLSQTETIGGVSGSTTTYAGYNAQNLPASESVSSASGVSPLLIEYQYDVLGETTQISRYADLAASELVDTISYDYDAEGRLYQITDTGTSGTLDSLGYSYNGESEIYNATQSGGWESYTYDPAGQLETATYSATPGANENYTYDPAGNRTSTTTGSSSDDSLQTSTSTTTAGNQLQSDGTFVYQYDANGNLASKTRISQADASDYQTLYSYDNENRLIEVTTQDNSDTITQAVTYTYNALDQRTSESMTAGGTTTVTNFVYDAAGNVALSFNGSGALSGSYYYGNAVDQLLAQEDGSGNVSWMITDRDQSVRDVVQYNSSTGVSSVVDHIDYNSFGQVIDETHPAVAHLTGYAGYINDAAIGLSYDGARYYDAAIGRFISTDPSGFSGSANGNLYGYASNSPVDMTDPTGLHPEDPVLSVLSQVSNNGLPSVVSQSWSTDSTADDNLDDSDNSVTYSPGTTTVQAPTSVAGSSYSSLLAGAFATGGSAESMGGSDGGIDGPEVTEEGATPSRPFSNSDIADLNDLVPMLPGENEADYLAQYGGYRAESPESADSDGDSWVDELSQATTNIAGASDPLVAALLNSSTQNNTGYYSCISSPAPLGGSYAGISEGEWNEFYQQQLSADAWTTRGQSYANTLVSLGAAALDFVNPVSIYNDGVSLWDNGFSDDLQTLQTVVSDPGQYISDRAQAGLNTLQAFGDGVENLIETPEGQGKLLAYGTAAVVGGQVSGFLEPAAVGEAGALGEAGVAGEAGVVGEAGALGEADLTAIEAFEGEGGALSTGPQIAPINVSQNTVTRYVGPVEANIAQETGFIPNVDRFGNPKTVFVTPEAPLSSAAQAESAYMIGAQNPFGPTPTPTHVIIGDASGVPFNYGGIVDGANGVEMTTRAQIPVLRVEPIGGN